MTKRQPSGTPVGGQFAPDRKPDGGDLFESVDLTAVLQEPLSLEQIRGRRDSSGYVTGRVLVDLSDAIDGDLESFLDTLSEKLIASPLGMDISYEVAGSQNGSIIVEVTLDPSEELNRLGETEDQVGNNGAVSMKFGDHEYEVESSTSNDVTTYTVTDPKYMSGWRFEYDHLTRRVKARGVSPINPDAQWRERGEADIRTVVRTLESDAKLIELNGDTYLVGGNPWPLSNSHLSGISTGQMMLTSGKTEHDLRLHSDQQRADIARGEVERPDLAKSLTETRYFLEGIEIAADLGEAAAQANTVGAMKARFG